MTTERAELCGIINDLPDEAFHAIKDYVLATKNAYDLIRMQAYLASIPEDDEPVTEEDLKDFALAEDDIKHGRLISHEQLKRELGL